MPISNWLNSDGLYIKYGSNEVIPNLGGEYRNDGSLRENEQYIALTSLAAFGTVNILNDVFVLPKTSIVEKVTIEVVAAATGASATLSLGTMKTDRTTAVSATAFANAVAQTAMTPIGTFITLTAGATGAGGSLGASVGADPVLLTATVNTANFSAGVIRVRYYWRPVAAF